MTQLQLAKAWLDGVNPSLFPLLVVFALWGGQWAVRRWLPQVWEGVANLPFGKGLTTLDTVLRKAWQGIPSVAGGAVLLWAAGGGDLVQLVVGAVVGALAPVLHEGLKALPGPYGQKPK